MPQTDSILRFAHRSLRAALSAGDWAVDATAGNGHDTQALAEAVGPDGRVWAFDVQEAALSATRERLEAQGLEGRVALLARGHEAMRAVLPEEAAGRVQAVTFNLGYFPGATPDGRHKALTTAPPTTLPALRAAAALLAPGGVLTVVCYTGHAGGPEETAAVRGWAEALPQERFRVLGYRFLNQRNDPPRLFVVEKTARGPSDG